MAFKLAISETYTATVCVALPGDKVEKKFDVEFHRLRQAELDELIGAIKRGEMDDEQFARRVLAGWNARHVLDADGNAVEFSSSALDELLGIFPVPASIVQAFFDSIGGARLKN